MSFQLAGSMVRNSTPVKARMAGLVPWCTSRADSSSMKWRSSLREERQRASSTSKLMERMRSTSSWAPSAKIGWVMGDQGPVGATASMCLDGDEMTRMVRAIRGLPSGWRAFGSVYPAGAAACGKSALFQVNRKK